MKKIISVLVLVTFLMTLCDPYCTYGQGTKLSSFPIATGIDANVTFVGVWDSAGWKVDKRYRTSALAAYLVAGQALDQVLYNGNSTTRSAQFTDGGANSININHSTIDMYAPGHHAMLAASALYMYNTTTGGYSLLSSDANPSVGISNVSGSKVGYIIAPTVTADRNYRMPDSTGTVALLQNLNGFLTSVDTGVIATRTRVQKAVDSLGALPRIEAVNGGYGAVATTVTHTVTVSVDSAKFATRSRVQKAVDSLGGLPHVESVIAGYGAIATTATNTVTVSVDSAKFATRARVQKAVDSLAGDVKTLANSKIFVGNASNIAAAVTASGDATISNTGVIVVDSSKFATRNRVQKVVDSLNTLPKIESVIAGYGTIAATATHTVTVSTDSSKFATRARVQKAVDSLSVLPRVESVIAGYGTIATTATHTVTVSTDSSKFATRARVQKAVDSLNGVPRVTSVTAGTGLSGGTITTTGTISMPNTGTAGTYGDATHFPAITTDAQGRISAVTTYSISAGGGGSSNIANTSLRANGDYVQHWAKKKLFFDSVKVFTVVDTLGDSLINMGISSTLNPSISGRYTTSYDVSTNLSVVSMFAKGGYCGTIAMHAPGGNVNGLYQYCGPANYTYITSETGAARYQVVLGGTQMPIYIDSGTKYLRLTDDTIQLRGTTQVQHLAGYNPGNTTIVAGTGAGTSPSISISGDDLGGYITVTTGSSPVASGTVATITFGTAFYAAPRCIILSPADSGSSFQSGTNHVFVKQTNTTVSSFMITAGTTPLTASTAYKWYYFIKQ